MPNEPRLIDSRVCNALIASARPNGRAWFLFPAASLEIVLMRGFLGGLWVGGVLQVYQDHLRFEANTVNRLFQADVEPQVIPLAAVTEVRWRSAFITNIIEVKSEGAQWSFRCYGAEGFTRVIEQALADYRGGGMKE